MPENNEAIIIQGTIVEGKISGDADLRVEGIVTGEIHIARSVTVAKNGKTEATVEAANVFIEGRHKGDVIAKELIQIAPDAVARANLKAPAIAIEKGAKFTGSVEMSIDDKEA